MSKIKFRGMDRKVSNTPMISRPRNPQFTLSVLPTAEQNILGMLRLSNSERKRYKHHKEERRACLRKPSTNHGPEVDVITIRL